MNKPSNVTTAGALLLAGGIWSLLFALVMTASTCGIWFTSWTYAIAASIIAIVNGARLLGDCQGRGVPKATSILQILQVLQGDVIGMTLGIIALVMLSDQETKDYLEGRAPGNYMNAGYGQGTYGVQPTAQADGYGQQAGYGAAGGFGQQPNEAVPPAPGAYAPPTPDASGWARSGANSPPNWSDPTASPSPPAWPDSEAPAVSPPAWPETDLSTSPPAWGDEPSNIGFDGLPGTGTAAENLTFDEPHPGLDDPPQTDPYGDTHLGRYRIAPWDGDAHAETEVATASVGSNKDKDES